MRTTLILAILALSYFGQSQTTFTLQNSEIDVVRHAPAESEAFGGCAAGSFDDTGLFTVCPDNFVCLVVSGADFPASGGYGFNFLPNGGTGGVPGGFSLSDFDIAEICFNNTIQGSLVTAGFDPMLGDWIIQGFAYTNGADINGTICEFAFNEVAVEFLGPSVECEGCDAGTVQPLVQYVNFGASGALTMNDEFVPTGGNGIGWNFTEGTNGSGGLEGGFNIVNGLPNYNFDADLNGLMSGNGLDPLAGEWIVTGFVYTDPDDAAASACSVANETIVYFGALSDCESIQSGLAPYIPTDPIFIQVIIDDPLCCTIWDDICQAIYDSYYFGCTYGDANNFDVLAVDDDGSCDFNCFGDGDGDGFLDTGDLLMFLSGYGLPCE